VAATVMRVVRYGKDYFQNPPDRGFEPLGNAVANRFASAI
jgi:hypothetical protein